MRRHVEGVRGGRRNLPVGLGVAQAKRRVRRVVVGMDQVVHRPGMQRVRADHILDDGRRAHVGGEVAPAVAGAEQRERVERLHFQIVGIPVVHPAHVGGIGRIARQLLALAVERLDGAQPHLLLVVAGLGQALVSARAQPAERGAGRVGRRLAPERVVVCHRLAPIGHRERRSGLLSLHERLFRIVVLERVEKKHAANESVLSRAGLGSGEVDFPERVLLRERGRAGDERQHDGHEEDGCGAMHRQGPPCWQSNASSRGFKARGFKARGFKARGFKARGFKARGVQSTGVQSTGVQSTGVQSTGVQSTRVQSTGFKARGFKARGFKARGQSTEVQSTEVQSTEVQSTGSKRRFKARRFKARGFKARRFGFETHRFEHGVQARGDLNSVLLTPSCFEHRGFEPPSVLVCFEPVCFEPWL